MIETFLFCSIVWNTEEESDQQFAVVNKRGDILYYEYCFTHNPEPQLDIHCVNQWGSGVISSLFFSDGGKGNLVSSIIIQTSFEVKIITPPSRVLIVNTYNTVLSHQILFECCTLICF